MSHDEVETAPEADSIPADDDTDVSESQVQIEVPVVSQDTTGATAAVGRAAELEASPGSVVGFAGRAGASAGEPGAQPSSGAFSPDYQAAPISVLALPTHLDILLFRGRLTMHTDIAEHLVEQF